MNFEGDEHNSGPEICLKLEKVYQIKARKSRLAGQSTFDSEVQFFDLAKHHLLYRGYPSCISWVRDARHFILAGLFCTIQVTDGTGRATAEGWEVKS